MPYPDNFSSTAFDAAQGVEDDDEPESIAQAAADFIAAMDHGYVVVDRPHSAYVTALRLAVERWRMWNVGA